MTEVPSSPEQNPEPSVVIDSNATVKKSRLPIFAAAAVVVALVAFTVVYFVTNDTEDYKPGPVATGVLRSLETSGAEIELTSDQLRCIDDAGKGIDPATFDDPDWQPLDDTSDADMAAFVGTMMDDCLTQTNRIDAYASSFVADGSGTPEASKCAAEKMDEAIMSAGGYTVLLSEGQDALLAVIFGLMGAMAECGISMMGD
ncbi:MAG: hypothetical protein Q7V57_08200 [Actinomycetota bacterium]|nr:hypothetical protein [Actinomycetota bacterium]